MKRVILLALVIAMFAGFANAQPGRIAMYSDAGYSNCTGTLQAVGLVGVYVVHENTGGALVSQFLAVDDPTLPPSIWLTDSFPVGIVASGDTHTGVILSYVTCHSGTFLVATMQYFAQSTTTPCVATRVIPDPHRRRGRSRSPIARRT